MSTRLVWKRRAGRMLRASRAAGPRRVILTYHAVASGPWSMPAEAFTSQMAWLAAHAQVLPLDTLLQGAGADLSVAVTFDDGYESVATAAGIMRRSGCAGTVFVNTAFIGDGRHMASSSDEGHYPGERFLDWESVRALRAAGWIVGSHGARHLDLSRLAPDALHEQLATSKEAIEQRLGEPCRYFAYPWGHHNRTVRAAVAGCGYESAMAAVHGVMSGTADRFAVPRITVRNGLAPDDFAALVRGDWDYLRYVQSARQFLHTRLGVR